jgi:hypothetical protein
MPGSPYRYRLLKYRSPGIQGILVTLGSPFKALRWMNGKQSRDVRMGYPCSNCVDAEYKCQRPVTNPVITTELLRGPEGEEIIQPWECPIP